MKRMIRKSAIYLLKKILGVDGKLVVVESPYKGNNWEETDKNVEYAKECTRHCFLNDEYPFTSHLFYAREGVLDDKVQEERKMGMGAGFNWGKFAELTVVYNDRGISEGMLKGIEEAKRMGRPVEERSLYRKDLLEKRIIEII